MRMKPGYSEIVVCTLAWGSLGLVRKQIDLPSGVVAFFRMGFGAIVVVGWLTARGRLAELRARARPWLLVSSGVVLGLHWVLELEAFRRLDIAAAILIVFLGPVLAAIAAPAVLGERLRAPVVGALALALGGIALISLPQVEHVDPIGLIVAAASAVLFAAMLLLGKLLTRDHANETLVVWQLSIGALVVSPALIGASGHQIARALPLLALIGAVFTGVLGVLFFQAVRSLFAQRLGVLFYLEPASAVLYAWVFLGEHPGGLTLTGGALVVVAGLAIILSDRDASLLTSVPEAAGGPT